MAGFLLCLLFSVATGAIAITIMYIIENFETVCSWFPIINYIENVITDISEGKKSEDFILTIGVVIVIVITLALLILGVIFATNGLENNLPLLFNAIGSIMIVVGYNLDGKIGKLLFVLAGIFIIIGFIKNVKNGFFSSLFGTAFLQGGLVLLPSAIVNFVTLLCVAVMIVVLIFIGSCILELFKNANIIWIFRR